jgi:hypothetical protein
MPSHPRIGARRGHVVTVDLAQWPDVDHHALPDQRRSQYLIRRTAVTMYLAGASDAELKQATGLARSNVYRIIADRCLLQNPDGMLMGRRRALPFFRVKGQASNLVAGWHQHWLHERIRSHKRSRNPCALPAPLVGQTSR